MEEKRRADLIRLWRSMFGPLLVVFFLLQLWLLCTTGLDTLPALLGNIFFLVCDVIMLYPLVKLKYSKRK